MLACVVLIAPACKTARNNASQKIKAKGGNGPLFATEADKIHFESLFFDGLKTKSLGRYDEAAAKFEQCLKITERVADVYYQLYLCYTQMRKAEVMTMLNKAVELAPKNTWYLEEKAEALRDTRKNAEAAEVYKLLVELSPEVPAYYDNAVEQLVMAGRPGEAIEILDKMESQFGVSEDIIRKKEDLYLYLGKTEKAIAEMQKLVNMMPGNTEYLGLLAELYSINNQTDKALEIFNKILAVEPANGKAHFGLAAIYRLKGDSAKTISELRLGFADKEVSLKEKINVIISMAPLGDNNLEYRKQIQELAKIMVDAHPDQPESHAIYGDLLFGDGQLAKAAQEYKQALARDENNFKVWQQLLDCYEQLGDYTNLAIESDKALELFPDRVLFYYYNANAEYNLRNYKKAAATAQAGLDLGIPDHQVNLGLFTVLGDADYYMGRYEDCYTAFDAALAIDPGNPYVLNNYAYYLSEQGERLEKALQMAKKALDLKPDEPSYLDTYGWILYKSGRYTDALEYVEKALEKIPGDKEILEHMGDIEYRLGNKDKAVMYWRKSKENGNDSVQLDKKINEGKLID